MEARYYPKLNIVHVDEQPGRTDFPADSIEAASRGLAERGYRRTAGWLPGNGGGIFVAEVDHAKTYAVTVTVEAATKTSGPGTRTWTVTMDAKALNATDAADKVVNWHAETFGGPITLVDVREGSVLDTDVTN